MTSLPVTSFRKFEILSKWVDSPKYYSISSSIDSRRRRALSFLNSVGIGTCYYQSIQMDFEHYFNRYTVHKYGTTISPNI